MTVDGICDHTAGVPDAAIHQHYQELLNEGDLILYGRKTYQLMEFWQTLLENPSTEKSMNDFALAIDKIQKIVFSNTLNHIDWKSAKLAQHDLVKTVTELKQSAGNTIYIGSRSLILQSLNHNLIDELQLCIHPLVAGKGLPLFENISTQLELKLLKTKTFDGGHVILYYDPRK